MNIDNTWSNKKNLLIGTLLVLAALAAIVSSVPMLRSWLLRNFQTVSDRHILAKLEAVYGSERQKFLFFKIENHDGISVEIYQETADAGQKNLKQKFELLHDSDAYINLDKNATNFALSDVDKDGQLDLLAPSVDQNGDSRLNIYRYNSDLNSFETFNETPAN